MKLSKTKKILLLGTTLAILTTSIVTPVVLLNKNENTKENDVEKLFKILKTKTTKEKIIELSNSASGKIIANNQEKIIAKIKTLIGKANLNDVKIEVLMKDDSNISTIVQKIIIKLTKKEFSKQIKDFLVKRKSTPDEDIIAIKKVLDAKSGNDLIIILPSSSTGNIIENIANKNAILKKLRILIDPSNTNGEANHESLRKTSIEVSMNADAPISITPQNIIVLISKTNGTTLKTTSIFQVKREFTANEDLTAIKEILESKTGNDLIITLPSDSSGSIKNHENSIAKKLRILIDSSNTNGDPNHWSLRGVSFFINAGISSISTTPKYINIIITKHSGKTLFIENKFQVQKS